MVADEEQQRPQGTWCAEVGPLDWAEALHLTTTTIGVGGYFLQTDRRAPQGTAVELVIELPEKRMLRLDCVVVFVVSVRRAAAANIDPGLALRIDAKHEADLSLFAAMAASLADGGAQSALGGDPAIPAVLLTGAADPPEFTTVRRVKALERLRGEAGVGESGEFSRTPSGERSPSGKAIALTNTAERGMDEEWGIGGDVTGERRPLSSSTPVSPIPAASSAPAANDWKRREDSLDVGSLFDPPELSSSTASTASVEEAGSKEIGFIDSSVGAAMDARLEASPDDSDDDIPIFEEIDEAPVVANDAAPTDELDFSGLDEPEPGQSAMAPSLGPPGQSASVGAISLDDALADQLLELAKNVDFLQKASEEAGGHALRVRHDDPDSMPPMTSELKGSAQPGAARAASVADLVFGVDFGTTFSTIAVILGDEFHRLEDDDGHSRIPSVVCFEAPGKPALVGWPAKEKIATFPKTTFVSPKRLIGRRFDDPKLQPYLAGTSVEFKAGPNDQIVADVHGSPMSLPQVVSEIFGALAQIGARHFDQRPKRVVLSTPVAFGMSERRAIERAAKLAGLEVLNTLEEPVSAAIAYGMGSGKGQTVAVYDFGGGTFDFTLLEVKDNRFKVIAVAGDDWLGGDDFDLALATEAAEQFQARTGVDLRLRQVEWQVLLMLAEATKRKLSNAEDAEIVARGIVSSLTGRVDLRLPMTRSRFDALCSPLVDRSIETVKACLASADVTLGQIDTVVMTGGVSRIPAVRRRVEQCFEREVMFTINPEQAVVAGNALFGHYQALAGIKLL